LRGRFLYATWHTPKWKKGRRMATHGSLGTGAGVEGADVELGPKQQRFVDAYLGEAKGNATEAARLAGYKETRRESLAQQGSRLYRNVEIQAAIRARVSELAMTAEEVLAGLAEIARGDMGLFVEGDHKGNPRIRLDAVENPETGELGRPNTRLVKRLTVKERSGDWGSEEEVSLELYSRQEALVQLGRYHGLFVDKTELSGPGGGPLAFREVEVEMPPAAGDAGFGDDEPLEG
jgi:hypothetical protein